MVCVSTPFGVRHLTCARRRSVAAGTTHTSDILKLIRRGSLTRMVAGQFHGER